MLRFKQRTPPTSRLPLTASQKRVQRTLLTAINDTQAQVTRDEGKIIDSLNHFGTPHTVALINDQPWFDAQAELEKELLAELIDGGKRVRLASIEKARLNFRFDAARPEAAAWAGKEAGVLIREVVQDQVNVVRDLVSRASMGEFTGPQVARQLRDSIGITTRQAGWVSNFRDRTFQAQIGDGRSFADAMARTDRLTDRYARRIHVYRTEMIARTEILRASHEGRRQAWSQGIEQGFISPNDKKYWSANDDDRLCEDCAAMASQYDESGAIPLSDDFELGEPPVHPMCRCDITLKPSGDTDLSSLSQEQVDQLLDEIVDGFPAYRGYELPTPINIPGNTREYGLGPSRAAKAYRDKMVLAEPKITRTIVDISEEFGATPEGLAHRLKSEGSLTRKIRSQISDAAQQGKKITAKQAAESMSDVIRYTYTIGEETYAQSTKAILDSLLARGFTTRVKNYWQPNNTYKGINVALKDPNGIPVELQFHTPRSLAVKEGALHQIYERQRLLTDPILIRNLDEEMRRVAAEIPTPRGDLSFGEQLVKAALKVARLWRGVTLGSGRGEKE